MVTRAMHMRTGIIMINILSDVYCEISRVVKARIAQVPKA